MYANFLETSGKNPVRLSQLAEGANVIGRRKNKGWGNPSPGPLSSSWTDSAFLPRKPKGIFYVKKHFALQIVRKGGLILGICPRHTWNQTTLCV